MGEPLTVPGVRVVVTRHLTDEESIQFESFFAQPAEAEMVAASQLALVRDHMRRYNEEVLLIDQKKSAELTEEIAAKGEDVTRLKREIEELNSQLAKGQRRLKSA